MLKLIGQGGFSRVLLARSNISQQLHALKVIDKHFIIAQNKKHILFNERDILIKTKHPFVVRLDAAF